VTIVRAAFRTNRARLPTKCTLHFLWQINLTWSYQLHTFKRSRF